MTSRRLDLVDLVLYEAGNRDHHPLHTFLSVSQLEEVIEILSRGWQQIQGLDDQVMVSTDMAISTERARTGDSAPDMQKTPGHRKEVSFEESCEETLLEPFPRSAT